MPPLLEAGSTWTRRSIGGLNGYDTNRTALEGTARGRTTGGDLNVLVAGGYDWKKGGFSIGPTASFQYTLVGFGDFTESGSLAPLSFPAQHADSFRTAFGMKSSYDWKIGPIHLHSGACGLPGSMNLGTPTTRLFRALPTGRATASRSTDRRSGATACLWARALPFIGTTASAPMPITTASFSAPTIYRTTSRLAFD